MSDEQAERIVVALENFVRVRGDMFGTMFGIQFEPPRTIQSTRAELLAALKELGEK